MQAQLNNNIMTVRVVSYNLLVPIYANQPEYYHKCQPKYLETDYRWNLIRSQLEKEILHHENTVICLQEISLTMLSTLELFFRPLKYSLFHNLYGQCDNDYMGVGIAIPISMQLDSISIVKIGDHIRSFAESRNDEENENKSEFDELIQLIADPWETAMARANTLINLKIIINDKSLCIGTYHMPCLYKQPGIMAIHSSIVKDLMFQLADGQNFILAGDFNMKPCDINYLALTEKNCSGWKLPQSRRYEISYKPNTEQILKSAYKEKSGTEPKYTNFVDTADESVFCATLDYIFFNGHLKVDDVLELPDQPISESYPDETHPSDHLMIAATFQL